MSLDDRGKLAQELCECLDVMLPGLAGLGVSVVGLEMQCHWVRRTSFVPSQPIPRQHLFLAPHEQSTGLNILHTFLHLVITQPWEVPLSSLFLF